MIQTMYYTNGKWEQLYPIDSDEFLRYILRNSPVICRIETTDAMDHKEGFNLYIKLNEEWGHKELDALRDLIHNSLSSQLVTIAPEVEHSTDYSLYGTGEQQCVLYTVWLSQKSSVAVQKIAEIVTTTLSNAVLIM